MLNNLTENKERKADVRIRITLLLSQIITTIVVCIGIYAVSVFTDRIEYAAERKLMSDLALGEQIIDLSYPGPWQLVNGHLYKGMTLMEERHEILDQIGELTGDTVTVFRGATRVSTNVTQENIRLINTQVYDEVKKVVLINGETYQGSAIVVGTKNYTAYKPIKNNNGEIIGIWYMGVPATPYEKIISEFRNKMILYSTLGILMAFLLILFLSNTLYKPSERFAAKVEITRGDAPAYTKPAMVQDELDQLSFMLNDIKEKNSNLISKAGISFTANDTGQIIQRFGIKSQEIMPIVDLITNIARQTTFLAWSATIEASEAGEKGRRFTGVIEQVRQLAEESDYAAKQIAEIINELQNEVNKAVKMSADSAVSSNAKGVNELTVEQIAEIEVINTSIDGLNRIIEALEDAIDRFKV